MSLIEVLRRGGRTSSLAALAVLALAGTACRAGDAPAVATAPPADGTAATTAALGADDGAAPTIAPAAPTSGAAAVATARAAEALPRFERMFGQPGTADGQLQLPFCIAVDAEGRVYVGDSVGLQAFEPDGRFIRRFGGDTLGGIVGLAVTPDGATVYAASQAGDVLAFDAAGDGVRTMAAAGGAVTGPAGLALDAAGALYVADARARQVVVLGPDGGVRRTIGAPGSGNGQFTSPRAIAVDRDGQTYIGLGDDYLVQRFDASGAYVDSIGHTYADETMFRVAGIALDDAGRMFVARAANHYIGVYDTRPPKGRWIGDVGTVGSGPGQFNTPSGIAYHDGHLFVADQDNHRVDVLVVPPAAGD